jgi:hypothetical protein
VRHWSKKPAALVALAGAEATRATPAPAFSLTRAIVYLYAADKSIGPSIGYNLPVSLHLLYL